MRLTQKEIQHLVDTIKDLSPPPGTKLILYGSRVHDHLKGGDIDLVLQIPSDSLKIWKAKRTQILVGFKTRLGERKIDLSILDEAAINSSDFFKATLTSSIILQTFTA